jgi:large subunit ribosomal protein L10
MALSRQKKAEKVGQLAKELEHSTSAIVGTFTKLTVAQDFELRKTVRAAGGRYRVLKNKLAARAGQGTKIEAALQGLKGVSSVAYTSGDPVALAKALSTWVTENAEFTFKLGIVDGKVIDVEEVKALASMPGREEIFAKLLFLINSPAQRLATVINATGSCGGDQPGCEGKQVCGRRGGCQLARNSAVFHRSEGCWSGHIGNLGRAGRRPAGVSLSVDENSDLRGENHGGFAAVGRSDRWA